MAEGRQPEYDNLTRVLTGLGGYDVGSDTHDTSTQQLIRAGGQVAAIGVNTYQNVNRQQQFNHGQTATNSSTWINPDTGQLYQQTSQTQTNRPPNSNSTNYWSRPPVQPGNDPALGQTQTNRPPNSNSTNYWSRPPVQPGNDPALGQTQTGQPSQYSYDPLTTLPNGQTWNGTTTVSYYQLSPAQRSYLSGYMHLTGNRPGWLDMSQPMATQTKAVRPATKTP